MSRTHRHIIKGKVKRLYGYDWDSIDRDYPNYWNTLHNTPSEWNNRYHERPFRRKNRNILKTVMQNHFANEDVDDIVFPSTHKKPHIYYW